MFCWATTEEAPYLYVCGCKCKSETGTFGHENVARMVARAVEANMYVGSERNFRTRLSSSKADFRLQRLEYSIDFIHEVVKKEVRSNFTKVFLYLTTGEGERKEH